MPMISLFSKFLDLHLLQYVHPVVEAETGNLHFYEVLSRVYYDGVLYSPHEFLEDITINQRYKLAEKLFEAIGKMQKKYPTLSFSMNLSALEIDMGMDKFLVKLTTENNFLDIDPKRCVIELTECSIINDKIYKILHELKNKTGFKLALDDFGSKYSTLKQVQSKNSVFDYVKIDGSLVEGIEHDEIKRLDLKEIIKMIQRNGKKAIVEYVSNEAVCDLVLSTSPDYLQGFLFGEPMPIEKYLERIDGFEFFSEHLKNKLASCM